MDYAIKFSAGQTNNKGEDLRTITTTTRGTVNGVLTFNFMSPIFYGAKQRLLCDLATHYAIPFEDLWTDDLINCEKTMMGEYAKTYHYNQENIINNTVGKTIPIKYFL